MEAEIGIIKIGGVSYISDLPSFTNMPDFTAPAIPSVNKVTYKSTIVTGKAEIGSTVYVYNGKKFVSKAVADTKGNYKIKIKTQKKRTTLTIFTLDKAGNKSSSVTIKVN